MKFALVLLGFALTVGQFAFADETVGEKAAVVATDAGRGLKKGANRVSEALCMEGDLKCAGKKAKNRIIEGKDAAVDGASELKNKVD
ncbi:MAG TPA: hypothetical protein VNJ08_11100 [Bacteriovoracaceae bacterium]|nr:hypothetical protein [Bacteriovoracaceae bacterium]